MVHTRFFPLPPIRVVLFCLGLLAFPAVLPAQSSSPLPPRQETVVVTGEPQAVPLEEADRAVTSLDVRDNSPELFRSWTDYVQLDPALSFEQRAPNGVQGDLSIRGAGFNQSLVLVNGFRVNDAQAGHHNLDIPLPLVAIDRIEVLHGAGSTLYGSDAMGGAINFITVPPAVTELRLGTGVGNFGTNNQYGSASYASDRVSEQLSFSRDFSDGFAFDRDYRSAAIASNSRFSSGLGQSSVLLGFSDRPFGANGFYGDYPSWERTKAWFASLSQQIGDRTEFDLGYRRHTDEFVLFRADPAIYENNHVTDSWQVALRRSQPLWENAKLFYGVEGYRDSIDSSNLGLHARNEGAGYASLDVRAWKRFSFTAGLRDEVYGDYQNEISPMASAGYWLNGRLKLRATASHGFRIPTYTELYYSQPGLVGNAALKPESAWNYEGGLDWHATDRFTGILTVFHRREHNDIDYVMPVGGSLYTAENIDRLNFTGVEATLRVRLAASQQLEFSYAGIHGSQQALANLVTMYVGNYPTSNGVVAWQGSLPGKFTARTRIGVTQRENQQGPYGLWDVSAMRQFNRVSAYVQFANLTNTSYQEIPGVAMPGRSVLGGVEFAWSRAKAK
jgi:iron complex outermembrane receptor protein